MTASRRGANAVEFALLAPVILLLTFGMIDYGWYFATYAIAQRAAQQGAQSGGQTPLDEDPTAAAERAAAEWISDNYPASKMPVSVDAEMTTDTVIIRLDLKFVPLAGFVPTPALISCSSERLLEEQPEG